MLNSMTLQGRLVRDPELRTTQSGVSVASFTVAWSEKYKETETQLFLDCTAWRHTGEFVNKYFSKGQEIVVEGRLETQKWVTDDGQNRSTIKMIVDKAHFSGPKQDSSNDSGGAWQPAGEPVNVGFEPLDNGDGELPF